MSEHLRVIENPDDGTSSFRARIVRGDGATTKLIAMFCDSADAYSFIAREQALAAAEAKAALAEEMAQDLRIRVAVNLQRIPATLFEDWLARYDALDQGKE